MKVRVLATLLGGLWFLGTTALAQYEYYLPQVAAGAFGPGGELGPFHTSTYILLFNNGSEIASVHLEVRADDGSLLPATLLSGSDSSTSVLDADLAAGQTRAVTVTSVNIVTGSARVSSTSEVGVSAVFSIGRFDGETDENGPSRTEAGVGHSPALNGFIIPVDDSGPLNTGIALMNVTDEDAAVVCGLRDQSGQASGLPVELRLPPRGHRALYIEGVGGLFPELTDFQGTMEVQSNVQVAAVALRQDEVRGGPLTTFPVVPLDAPAGTHLLPQVAQGFGIRTEFILFNLSASPGLANLKLTDANGAPLTINLGEETGAEFSIAVPARGATFLSGTAEGNLRVGAAQIDADVPLGVTSIFSFVDASGVVTTEAGVGDSPPLREFTVPVSASGDALTGLAVYNPNDTAATIEFDFITTETEYADPGEATVLKHYGAEKPLELAPGHQLARFLNELVGWQNHINGQLAVRSDLPLSSVALRLDNSEPTVTALPVVKGTAPAPGNGPIPLDRRLLAKRLHDVEISSDRVLDVQLERGVVVTATVSYPEGFFQTGVTAVVVADPEGEDLGWGLYQNSLESRLQVLVPKGTHDFVFCGENVQHLGYHLSVEPSVYLSHRLEQITVEEDTEIEIEIPGVPLRRITGQVGNLEVLPPWSYGLVIFSSKNARTVARAELESSGAFETDLAPGDYRVSLVTGETRDINDDGDPDGFQEQFNLYDIGRFSVDSGTDPVNLEFEVPDLVTISGHSFQSPGTDPIEAFVSAGEVVESADLEYIYPVCLPTPLFYGNGAFATSQEAYSMTLKKDSPYFISATRSLPELSDYTSEPIRSVDLSYPAGEVQAQTFSEDSTSDFTFPELPQIRSLEGTVTDPDGNPLAGAGVQVTGPVGSDSPVYSSLSAFTTTDSNGHFQLEVPEGSGFLVIVIPN